MKKSILLLFYLCITIAINAQSIGGNVLGVSFKSSLLETFNLLNYKGYCPKMVSLPAGHSIHYMIKVQNPPEYFLNWEECVIDSYVDNFWGRTNVWDVQFMKLYKDKSIADNDYAKLLMSLKPLYSSLKSGDIFLDIRILKHYTVEDKKTKLIVTEQYNSFNDSYVVNLRFCDKKRYYKEKR